MLTFSPAPRISSARERRCRPPAQALRIDWNTADRVPWSLDLFDRSRGSCDRRVRLAAVRLFI